MKNIDTPYFLSDENVKFFKKNKYIKLKNVFEKDTILYYNKVISEAVESLNTIKVPIEKRDTYGKAFLQLFNLWKESEDVKSLIFSKRLSQIATELMEVSGVRLYHDQAFMSLTFVYICPFAVGPPMGPPRESQGPHNPRGGRPRRPPRGPLGPPFH